jgi:mannosidase alpha-like ER degradation enhancer 2
MKYAIILTLVAALFLLPQIQPARAQEITVTPDMVKTEFLHAWNGYKQYAWGHDALKPLTKTYHDWHKKSLLMTPIDAFDTMELMGLTEEADAAKDVIFKELSFDHDFEVQSFEITIRLLGGLLSAYQMDGDKRFLALADDLGKRLLPVFNSGTGMPYRYVNLQTGKIRDSINNPAEIGTALIEFGTLSKVTGNPVYFEKAKKAAVACFNHRSKIGLVGTWINVETGEWTDKSSHISGAIDSYYEYLLKCAILFNDKECKAMWDSSIVAINTYLADTTHGGLWYAQAEMNTGNVTSTRFGALDAFFPAILALSGDLPRAKQLEDNAFKMWNLHGIEPEEIDYATMKVTYPTYVLRPEIIESAYYLYHYTHDPKYLKMGETFYNDLVKYCRTDEGYAALKDVTTHEKRDQMESFFLAETMKYLYLLMSQDKAIDFDKVIFNTEAHPIKRNVEK